MHPIERLRYVARAGAVDQGELVREAASALSGLSDDPGGLIMSCRRLLVRHPTAGALWHLCARLLTAGDEAVTPATGSVPPLPEPEPIVPTEALNLRLTGIGGTGVVTVAQVIGTAAMLAG